MPSAITIMKLRKTKGLLRIRPINYTTHLGPHSKVIGRERERDSAWAWGSAFTGVKGGSLGFYRSLLIHLKHKRGNTKLGRKTMAKMVSY